jgi:hypothetical protein
VEVSLQRIEFGNVTKLAKHGLPCSISNWYDSSSLGSMIPDWYTQDKNYPAPEDMEMVGIYVQCYDMHLIGVIFRKGGMKELR